MTLFELDTTKPDKPFCFIRATIPCAIELLLGQPARPAMEERELSTLDLAMNEDYGGLKLPDRVGNTQSLLVLSKPCAQAIAERFDLGEHEVLPARLINEKKRVHSENYVIVNPLGRAECLDVGRSDMDNDPEDPGVRIFGKYWLKADSVPDRALFRVKGVVGYIFTSDLVEFIERQRYTNFAFKPVQLS